MKDNQNTDLENDELYEHHKVIATDGQLPLRVDKFLMNFIENASRNKLQQAAKAGNILVNDIAVKANHKVKPKDVVRIVLAYPPAENLLVAENIPIDIIYEDDLENIDEKLKSRISGGMIVNFKNPDFADKTSMIPTP